MGAGIVFSESGNRPATSYRGSGRPSVIMTEVLVVVSTATLGSGGVSPYVPIGSAGLSSGVVPSPPVDPPWPPNRIESMVPEAIVMLDDAPWFAICRVMRNGAMAYASPWLDNHTGKISSSTHLDLRSCNEDDIPSGTTGGPQPHEQHEGNRVNGTGLDKRGDDDPVQPANSDWRIHGVPHAPVEQEETCDDHECEDNVEREGNRKVWNLVIEERAPVASSGKRM